MKDMKKLFTKDNLIVLVLAGILLFVIALPVGDSREAEATEIQTPVQTAPVKDSEEEQYRGELETRLEEIFSSIKGVGRVRVMITLKTSLERVVEKDQNGTESVYRTQSGNSDPFVKKTLMPKVEGVLIVAQGAGNGEVNRMLTASAEALLGIEAHRIVVVGMRPE